MYIGGWIGKEKLARIDVKVVVLVSRKVINNVLNALYVRTYVYPQWYEDGYVVKGFIIFNVHV